jgi:hypothetical protein
MNRQHSVYPSEGDVVRGQSKVEKAKYIHTENDLRRNLENISESFKRTNKRLSDETETLRSELHKLRQSVDKIQQEKMKRMKGEYHKRRPYQAERFLCDENIVTLRPFCDPAAKIITHRKSWAKKLNQRRLAPIKLHQNKLKGIDEDIVIYDKEKQPKALSEGTEVKQPVTFKLPKIEASLYTNDEPFTTRKETDEKVISKDNQTSRSQKHISFQEKNVSPSQTHCQARYLDVPRIPICDQMDIHAYESKGRANIMKNRPHFLPPLDKITEGEVVEIEPIDNNMNLVGSDKSLNDEDNPYEHSDVRTEHSSTNLKELNEYNSKSCG